MIMVSWLSNASNVCATWELSSQMFFVHFHFGALYIWFIMGCIVIFGLLKKIEIT